MPAGWTAQEDQYNGMQLLPAAISGRKGTAFYGQMKNDSGALLDVKLVIIPLESDLWATETLLMSQRLNAAQTSALNQAVTAIALTNGK